MLDGWRFCPRCGEAIESAPGCAACSSCDFRLYAGSAPTASALVVDGRGRVLLGRRAVAPDKGRWDFPGGFIEEHEHPLDALRRELREETGLDVEPGRYLGALTDWYGAGPDARSTLNLFWIAPAPAGEPRAADDVAELRWFDLDELPPADEIAFSATPELIRSWLRDEHA